MPDYTPEQWAQIHANAKAKLLANPQDERARAWFKAAEQFMVTQRQEANAEDAATASRGPIAAGASSAADIMSFGLGPKIARGMYPSSEPMIQQATQQQHPVADIVGKVLGFVGPVGVEMGAVKGVRAAPTAIRATVNAIKNRVLRAGAKTALNAAEGAAYAGAQAAGHDQPVLPAAGVGAVGGAALGAVPGALRMAKRPVRAVFRQLDRLLDDAAGKVIPRETPLDFDLLSPSAMKPPVSMTPTPQAPPDLLNVPTFLRRTARPTPTSEQLQLFMEMGEREFRELRGVMWPDMWQHLAKLRAAR